MDQHVSRVISSCNFHIRALRHICPRLTFDADKSAAVSIVSACLDYCKSLLHGTSQSNFDRLQRVQNSLARVVTQDPRRSSATDLRHQLHWLPIHQCVSFKLGTITFRAHRLSLRVSCIGINHWGHCALALLSLCIGLMPPLISTNTHLQSWHLEKYTCFHP